MSTHCSACVHMDQPGTGPNCGPCQWPLDPAERPSGFVPTQAKPLAQAPIHPPSAPFTDTQRLDWLLPVMAALDDPAHVGDKRTVALSAAFMLGKSGREAIDFAMEGSP